MGAIFESAGWTRSARLTTLLAALMAFSWSSRLSADPLDAPGHTLRVAAVQARARIIDFRLKPEQVLAAVERNLDELEKIVHRAGEKKCDALCFPEDTLGLLNWNGMNESSLRQVLPEAVKRMLDRLGRAAASHRMHLVVCSDLVEKDGGYFNTAFLLGRDGKEIGRYHKVCPTYSERSRQRGTKLPVFPTEDLGTVGLLICYDLVMPETARCLALEGADVIFFPTMGTAAIGDDDIGLQALRVRAVENFVWLVVAHRGGGAMVISPQGKIVSRADGEDGLAIAEIDPRGGREGGDAMNSQRDMRARLFRERNPEAFGILTNPHPPVLDKVPLDLTVEEAARIAARVLTVGEEEFNAASRLERQGKPDDAIAAYHRLRREYPGSWIDRVSAERLKNLGARLDPEPGRARNAGIASRYPGDAGIEKDSAVLFVEDFEEPSLDAVKARWETVNHPEFLSLSDDVAEGSAGRRSLLQSQVGGKGDGGHLYRRLPPGHDQVYARFYVKIDPDCVPIHHFGTCIGGNHPATPWPMVRAGEPPAGDKSFWVGIEPFGDAWRWDYYTYWCDMRGSPPRGQTWGNSFVRDPELKVERGKWTCVEVMVRVNDVGDTNGELALWIDGKPVSHLGKGFPRGRWTFDKFEPRQEGDGVRWNQEKGGREDFKTAPGGDPFEGFRWRTVRELNVNFVWTYVYITSSPEGHVSKVWFDHIVVATEYVGPLARK